MMHAKYFDAHIRWPSPGITRRQVRYLETALARFGEFTVGCDGFDGQTGKRPTPADLMSIMGAIRAARGTLDGVVGAIVPRGYRWRSGQGHGEDCDCAEIAAANDVNTLACVVAKAFAQCPPLIATGEEVAP
jgi:hypothetical protein